MKLFDKWKSATESYESFSEKCKVLASEVSFFLEYLTLTNDSFKNAFLKKFKGHCDGFSILVKEADGFDD